MRGQFTIVLLLTLSYFLMGCISNVKPAKYICSCSFKCTNGYEDIDYLQNIGIENKEDSLSSCFSYANNSCFQQGLELKEAECETVLTQEEFQKGKGGR